MHLCLSLAVTAQSVCPQVNLIACLIGPIDRVTKILDFKLGEMFGLAKPFEDSAFGKKRPQIDDALITIIKIEFQHAKDNRQRRCDLRELFHSIGPIR